MWTVRPCDVVAACRLGMTDVWVRFPPRALVVNATARYANRQCGQAQTLACVGSNPSRATPASAGIIAFGRAVGRQAACKAVAFAGNVGSIPTRGTGSFSILDLRLMIEGQRSRLRSSIANQSRKFQEARSSNGSGCQVVNLTARVQFPYEPPARGRLRCDIRPVRLAAQDDRFSEAIR